MSLFERIYQWSIHPSRGIEGFIVFVWLHVITAIIAVAAGAVPIWLLAYLGFKLLG